MTSTKPDIDSATRTELEAAAFRRLLKHLSKRTDVQNIDMMIRSGFCRNCLADWYKDAADEKGIALDKAQARHAIYAMPYEEWREKYQQEATPEQLAAYEATRPK